MEMFIFSVVHRINIFICEDFVGFEEYFKLSACFVRNVLTPNKIQRVVELIKFHGGVLGACRIISILSVCRIFGE